MLHYLVNMIASYTLDAKSLDDKFIQSLKKLFEGKKIRIVVDDELAISDPQRLRLLESLQQAERGETIKVDIDKFLWEVSNSRKTHSKIF